MSNNLLVAICIPTFQRPVGLKNLLEALPGQEAGCRVQIVVAENDAEGQQGVAVCQQLMAQGYPLPLRVVISSPRGISSARNALVECAMELGADVIAMIDDDEWPENAWLAELLAMKVEASADIVGGPVRSHYSAVLPDWVQNSHKSTMMRPRGLVPALDSTCNILFDKSVFASLPAPWFEAAFSLSGGEDKAFLTTCRGLGMRFAWAPEAWVAEDLPAARSTAEWAIQRAYRVGNSDTLIKLRSRGAWSVALRESPTISANLARSAFFYLMFWSPRRRFQSVRGFARVRGKIAALRGSVYREYDARQAAS